MHEQQGIRPAVVVGIPLLPAGVGNLTQTSVVLLDQIRAVDARRIVRYIGSLSEKDYQSIAAGL
ncbi:MAG: type II toxin-antitoxin system PemK/MazF family toxin, partial [Leptolyngbya sp. SIO4C1]|nr:type II toxin-antitoxin system PemK/MazF family toxin [Leptolyngbya sp. SIO4C1]